MTFPPTSGDLAGRLPEDTLDGRWLTYSELAAIRGITRESATKLVQRERWPRSSGNDRARTVRALVPLDWLQRAKEIPPEAPDLPARLGETSPRWGEDSEMLAAIQEAHASEIKVLREQRDRERERADQAEQAVANERERIDRLAQEFGEARRAADEAARAARVEAAAARQQADSLHRELTTAQMAASEAKATLDAARQQAIDAVAASEAAQIGRAEAEADAALVRANLEAARSAVQAAQERADGLAYDAAAREAERKGRGRWARLRAAWRGE